MDLETAGYILEYYSHLLPLKECVALKHMLFSSKNENYSLGGEALNRRKKIMVERGWLTEDEEILALLKEGNESFKVRAATSILSEHRNEVFLNYCEKCGRLARTPYAKQCRCGHNWH